MPGADPHLDALLDDLASTSTAGAFRQEVLAAAGDRADLATLLDPLALRAAAGDLACRVLLVELGDQLGLAIPTVRRLIGSEADAEEVLQDVLVAVAETVSGFRGDARFTTWLVSVARNKAISHLRRLRATEPLDEDAVGDAQRMSSVIATRTTIDDALSRLPAEYSQPVRLRDLQALGYEQIAQQLDLNVNTAKSRVARGRAMVAAQLGERP